MTWKHTIHICVYMWLQSRKGTYQHIITFFVAEVSKLICCVSRFAAYHVITADACCSLSLFKLPSKLPLFYTFSFPLPLPRVGLLSTSMDLILSLCLLLSSFLPLFLLSFLQVYASLQSSFLSVSWLVSFSTAFPRVILSPHGEILSTV